ncbi:adenylate/guanylate cyclase domain-containing protein [Oceanospirillum sanctuarii]|uniref:adenylate/guanylate cyclase domain-containing protein n=1 Tax=Oceanospirillum sanctuarii TaxID=1434821 RepID=UPI000A3A577E|nr:adenylate/guanylate cyclase domain-containing protein [Oceanospirillum sanctuarii]
MSQQPTQPVELSGQESNSLRDYISSHHTTVLTVMFTDIKGYTELTEEKGESYVEEIRRAHDILLQGIIEEDNSGLILKHIGDSVMAVFAEPSRAVDRAILIQQKLVAFNQENPQWDDIEVRIGLHMGQVTVEGEVTFDIFGRHVNRAARIEGLADGGQVYMSYTVFDSARSWLSHHTDFGWQSHGYFKLKGISEPVELFEAWDKNLRKPAPPKNAKAIKNKPRSLFIAAAVLLGVAITVAVNAFKATEVRLKAPYPDHLYTSEWQKVPLEGKASDPERRVALDFEAGEYPFFYLISESGVRYSTVRLERGDNLLTPDYKNYSLPAFYIRQAAEQRAQENSKEASWSYQAVNSKGLLETYSIQAKLAVVSQQSEAEDKAIHQVSWQLKPEAPMALDTISGSVDLSRLLTESGSDHHEEVIARFGKQKVVLKASLIRKFIQLRLNVEYD